MGRLTAIVGDELHKKVKMKAVGDGISLNQLVNNWCQAYAADEIDATVGEDRLSKIHEEKDKSKDMKKKARRRKSKKS